MKLLFFSLLFLISNCIAEEENDDNDGDQIKKNFLNNLEIQKRGGFYDDEKNFGFYPYHPYKYQRSITEDGFYAYHPKKSQRSIQKRDGFYDDPENFGFYAYKPKGYSRSIKKQEDRFYDNPDNFGFYAYQPKRYSRSSINLKKTDFENVTSCIYNSSKLLLSCKNVPLDRSVECKAYLNLTGLEPFKFEMFGIERIKDNSSEIKYNMFPFKINPSTTSRIFYNYQITINDNYITLALFNSDKFRYSGIRVEDLECYKKVEDLLESSSQLKKVEFGVNSVNTYSKILFIGEILISKDDSIEKENLEVTKSQTPLANHLKNI